MLAASPSAHPPQSQLGPVIAGIEVCRAEQRGAVAARTSCRHAPTVMARNARARSTVAARPRSEMQAIQSLLGHGFDVVPGSESLSDGSLRGTCLGSG